MEHHSRFFRRASGFTLLEVLVVITIIGLLMSVLFPALGKVRSNAKRAATSSLISSLGVAMRAYYNEYGRWPSDAGGTSSDTLLSVAQNHYLYRCLSGEDVWLDGSSGGNPRKISFLDIKPNSLGGVGVGYTKSAGGTTNLVNPWGNSIRVVMDYDGDGVADAAGITVNGSFAIYSLMNSTEFPKNFTNMSWQ